MNWRKPAAIAGVAIGLSLTGQTNPEQLTRHISLGKAFYENPTTQKEAAAEFKKALDLNPGSAREQLNYALAVLRAGDVKSAIQWLEKSRKTDPSLPHTYFNLGIIYKKEGDFPRAFQELTEMAKRVPDEPVTHFNLGMLHKLMGTPEKSTPEFEAAARIDPTLAAPHFQLYNSYRAAGKPEDAQREMATFNDLKKRMSQLGISEDMDWSYYSELLEEVAPAKSEGAKPVETVFQARAAGSIAGAVKGIAPLDADNDGRVDFVAWSGEEAALFTNGGAKFAKSVIGKARAAAVGDFNNDTFADVAIATAEGAVLCVNTKGAITPQAKPIASGRFDALLWIDYDHDYDLDLMALGAKSVLMRNNGDGTWSEQKFPFVEGTVTDAVSLEVGENNGFDIVMSLEGKPAVLYRDMKMGRYESAILGGALSGRLQVEDLNHDSFLDVAAVGPDGVALVENKRGTLSTVSQMMSPGGLVFADFQNRGRSDLLSSTGVANHAGGFAYQPGAAKGAVAGTTATAAEFTGDALIDAVVGAADGSLTLLANATASKHPHLRVAITGVKNIKLAPDARVEIKAGSIYQKKLYRGVPLLFASPGNAVVETVRITWPNGLIQNEVRQKSGASYAYKEAQRLSGSCPMIFTWNGEKFEFISDVLGVAPLGAGLGDGQFFPVDHDEYVQIAPRQLRERDGQYEIRVTEELREVSYLDQIKLIAVDHPSRTEIFTNDKFKSPPFPQFRLFGADRRIYPASARDQDGRDVLDRVTRVDRRYPDAFPRDIAGRAETHSVTLDFPGASNRAVLFLHGWVDWADGSTFVAVSQSKRGGLAAPSLQVKDASGQWVTVIEDMGMPAGKPKTIAVDLAGKFLSASREVRIVTSMAVYWDEAFLAENAHEPRARLTEMLASTADLRFRGFSAVKVHPERRQPESFDYHSVRPTAMWNPTPGNYTAYGDVRRMLGEVDDLFVVMGAGDELRLLFDARALPKLPADWTREFLIFFDGYAKDGDANTAYSSSVLPLPFHGMTSYPYPSGQRYPRDDAGRYNTRPALRLIRPLSGVQR